MTKRVSLVLAVALAATTAAANDHASSEARSKPRHPVRRLARTFRAERVAPPGTYQSLCDRRLAAGPAGHRDPRVDLSAAHALVRDFGVSSAYATSDIALAAALEHDPPLSPGGVRATLARYADGLDDV